MDWASKALNAIAAVAFVAAAIAFSSGNAAHADSLSDALDDMPTHVVKNYAGVAAAGYDVVAFVIQGTALKGQRNLTAEHEGATYRFADSDNRDIFLTDPDALMPQFGGYGAYGVRAGRKVVPQTPLVWQVTNDKLYFFVDEDTQALWNQHGARNTRIAMMLWQQIRTVPPAMLTHPAIN